MRVSFPICRNGAAAPAWSSPKQPGSKAVTIERRSCVFPRRAGYSWTWPLQRVCVHFDRAENVSALGNHFCPGADGFADIAVLALADGRELVVKVAAHDHAHHFYLL